MLCWHMNGHDMQQGTWIRVYKLSDEHVISPTNTGRYIHILLARFMGPTWGPSGADRRTQVGPMLAPWTLLSGYVNIYSVPECSRHLHNWLMYCGLLKSYGLGCNNATPVSTGLPLNAPSTHLISIQMFSFQRMRLKMFVTKCWSFCSNHNILNWCMLTVFSETRFWLPNVIVSRQNTC